MENNEDGKLKELKSDIKKFDRDTKKWMQKKWEQSHGVKWEDRWIIYKRKLVAGIVIAVLALGNIFIFTPLLIPYFSDHPWAIPVYHIGSWALIAVVMILLTKKYVLKK